ncbi:MAG: 2-amino-4-hydroxy-6-hydroxymethyldihydropteridine diphosphokinase [Phycisphaerae bacterium]|nr:2-amino-4-hydroxy-6-hydroxymethyldihydropteridine diphosphokinase [Phycisphaerae bacterium]
MQKTTPNNTQDTTVYIGLGSNLGNRGAYINKALVLLGESPGVKITAVSSIMETQPMGGPENQADYFNGVVEITCSLSAINLLFLLQSIENRLDRVRHEHWGARTIDLDLLLFGAEILKINDPNLVVPHPLMHKRLFTMVPMVEIAPKVIHPELNQTMTEIHDQLLAETQKAESL